MVNRWSLLVRKFLASKNFGLVIGFLVFLGFGWLAFASPFLLFQSWDRSLSDVYFKYRSIIAPQVQQEGVVLKENNKQISSDILILGVDNRSIEALGAWPFSRSLHADLLNALTRVQDSKKRERAVFFDFFFLDRERIPENDWAFSEAIEQNGRVFLETIYSADTVDEESLAVQFDRLDALLHGAGGTFRHVTGPWKEQLSFTTVYAPLIPFAQKARGYGTATFVPDHDDVFRRQILVSKVTRVVEEVDSRVLQPDLSNYEEQYYRYVYTNRQGIKVSLPLLTADVVKGLPDLLMKEGLVRQVLKEGQETPEDIYVIQKVQDYFLPSMPLALALDYWNVSMDEVEVFLGRHVRIPSPQLYDEESGAWRPAPFGDVLIPIDDQGAMEINFMGQRSFESGSEYQTFPVRSYSSYATKAPPANPESWPESRQLANKIVMVGQFSTGSADDEKNTPFGQMFGVEIHANALNTILMRNFLHEVPHWVSILVLFVTTLLIAFLASRTSTILSLAVTLLLVVLSFLSVLFLFEWTAYVYPLSSLLSAILMTFLAVIVYRALTEEREKRRVRSIFSKYVSPDVVTELLQHPPELGGVDKELTVLFSDIRGFTSLSEGMTPQELVNHLNLYLTAMTDIIHEYHGTLDKYVGDEIMCFWGAPLEQADHAVLASKCALRMMEKLEEMNSEWPENRKIRIGIGLNSGVMTVGNMGSQGRMNYTLMGDNVNLGARLEGTNKEYLTNVIISEFTYQHIREEAIVRELDNIRVKGKNKPVLIYELIDFRNGFLSPTVASKKK